MSATPTHLVMLTISGWGHVAPTLVLAHNLLDLFPSLSITLLADRRGIKRYPQCLEWHPEINRPFGSRWRVVGLVDPEGPAFTDEQQDEIQGETVKVFGGMLEKILKGDDSAPEEFRKVPRAMTIDVMRTAPFLGMVRGVVQKVGLSKESVKCYMCTPTFSVAHQAWVDDLTTLTELEKKGDEAAIKALEAAVTDPEYQRDDRANLPPMKAFEISVQKGRQGADLNESWAFRKMLIRPGLDSDGQITFGTPELEPEAIKRAAKMTGLPQFDVGYSQEVSKPYEQVIPKMMNHPTIPTDDGKAKRFLDDCMSKHGERSVAFVSLGSFGWTEGRPGQMDELITTLLTAEPPIPAIVNLASPEASLEKKTLELIEQSKKGLLLSWVPQKMILSHPATDFFVTHCGSGSVSEAIIAKVPLVMIPIYADQPYIAAQMGDLGAGIELLQFRTGHEGRTTAKGIKLVCTSEAATQEMRETWRKMRGPEGEAMRKKMGELSEVVKKSWASGGARENMIALGKAIIGA